MDRLDYAIIKHLYANCRIPYETLGRMLNTTPATVKNRIRKLRNTGKLGRFFIRLSCSAYAGQEIMNVIKTDGTEDRQNFIERIGSSSFIEYVNPCSGDIYLAQAVCRNIDEYALLHSFFNGFTEITSIDIHLTNHTKQNHYCLTKTQSQIITHLLDDPRRKSTVIAESINMSSKFIRKTIRRLRELNFIEFTVECFLSSLLALIRYDNSIFNPMEVKRELEEEFHSIWEFNQSSNESLMYVSFFSEYIDDMYSIQRDLKKGRYEILEIIVVEPRHYFSSLRNEELQRLIERKTA